MTFAEAKGLKAGRLFFRYGVRNALKHQVTGLALALSQTPLHSRAVLVELVLGYPRAWHKKFRARYQNRDLRNRVFYHCLAGIATLSSFHLLYPFLDPRISYENG